MQRSHTTTTKKQSKKTVDQVTAVAPVSKRQWVINYVKTHTQPLTTLLLVGVVGLVYAYRAHPYIRLPQLFAEDGNVWLAQGYNKPISALFEPVNGFLHVPERLFGIIMAHLPLHWAPFTFALAAWVLFILTAYYLISSRTQILRNTYERIFMAVCLALIGNLDEFFFNFSNSAFLIGIVGVLILIAKPSASKIVRILEKTFFFISCFCLTFPWLYLPIALIERFKFKQKNNFFLISSAVASVVQLLIFMSTHVNRSVVTLSSLWSKFTLLEIYNQTIVPAVRFARLDTLVHEFEVNPHAVQMVWFAVIVLLVAGCIGMRKSPRQVWYILFFLAAMTLASIKSPTITTKLPLDAIKVMSVVDGANRYFIYGIIGVNIIFIKAVGGILMPWARYPFLIGFTLLGISTSMHYKAFFIDKKFTDYTDQYNQKITLFESGKVNHVHILENPVTWSIDLYHK